VPTPVFESALGFSPSLTLTPDLTVVTVDAYNFVMEYKDTLNLPRTDFAMKADLVAREPQRLDQWRSAGLYARIQAARAGAEKFVFSLGSSRASSLRSSRLVG